MTVVFPAIAILAPLVGSGLMALVGRRDGERVASLGIALLVVSTVGAMGSLYLTIQDVPLLLSLPGFSDPLTYRVMVDRLASVMMVLITTVSLVIHVYSKRYMQGDEGYVRFFVYLSLLTFILLNVVSSGNLLWLFLWWHAVTWLLMRLLAYNAGNPAARQASSTIFWIHGLGDVAFLAGILVIYVEFGTMDLRELFRLVHASPGFSASADALDSGVGSIRVITLLIFIAIVTKSAQFPFHVWLPGTIEAPTPVSAMLHAGIVNAGGFLVNRLAPLYGTDRLTLYLLFFVGGLTALVGAASMLTQTSIKRTLVYSTMGQMGYMIMECGLGAFALAVFHLCAHGLFKATLFLNSGANIQKARMDFKVPEHHPVEDPSAFSVVTWATGLGVTLLLPLSMLLIAHGLVSVPLFEAQSAVIFLFFAWVTSSQAVFSLYRLNAGASWKVSFMMVATLTLIGLTYLWAGESFTHFLYPEPGQAAAYFRVAAWPQGFFDSFVVLSALLVVGVWVVLYARAHGVRLLLPDRLVALQAAGYVAFLNSFYVEEALRAWRARFFRGTVRARWTSRP